MNRYCRQAHSFIFSHVFFFRWQAFADALDLNALLECVKGMREQGFKLGYIQYGYFTPFDAEIL